MKPRVKFVMLIAALLVLCVFIGLGIVSLTTTGSGKFLPKTIVNGNDCGGLSAEEFMQKDDIKIKVTLASDSVDAQTVDVTSAYTGFPFSEESVKAAFVTQSRGKFPFNIFEKRVITIPADGDIDMQKLKDILSTANCVTTEKATPPADAYIKGSGDDFEIVPEIKGNQIDLDKLAEEVAQCLKMGKFTINTTKDSIKKEPEVTMESDYIKNFSNFIENMNNMEITFDFGDRQEKITADIIKNWQKVEDGNHIVFDEENIEAYVRDLAFKYDTYQKPHEFKTTNNGTITVESKSYGWRTDVKRTKEKLIETLQAGENATIEPVYVEEVNYYQPLSRNKNDIGDTYVEVSIEEQRVWLYKDGKVLVDTPVVTGMKNKNDTPKGLYCVWSRERDTIISNVHVDYWMPVDGVFGSGVGLHDASWKHSFGGSIYETNGSHGCINLPYDAAKTIYENIVAGTPVIIY